MNRLKFRRQFLFTPKKCSELKGWDVINLGSHYVYTHPDCDATGINKVNTDLILIGHVIDPKSPDRTTSEILDDLSNFETINDVSEKLYGLVGRFVLIIKLYKDYMFFNDACGLKLLFYTQHDGELYAASQPLLLSLVCDIKKGLNHKEYYASEYIKNNLEHWIPSGTSLYDNVNHLVPNHYLDSSKLEQIRFWPKKQLKPESMESAVNRFSDLFKKTMLAANKKFNLALPLTAGWDSKIILSSCKPIHKDLWCYTLKYRNLTLKSNDLKIPVKISSKLGLKYEIIDCHKSIDEKFAEVYQGNTDIPHIDDWGKIAHGMFEKFPPHRITVKGNCSEIGRCFYYLTGKSRKVNSSNDFLRLEFQWKNIGFIKDRISKWYDEVKHPEVNFGYNLYDLFYWEHRMGSWQAQSQLEWDIVQDAFTPFNNRELLDIALGVDTAYRCKPKYLFFEKVIENLWADVLSEPINPSTVFLKLKDTIKKILKVLGLLNTAWLIKKRLYNTRKRLNRLN